METDTQNSNLISFEEIKSQNKISKPENNDQSDLPLITIIDDQKYLGLSFLFFLLFGILICILELKKYYGTFLFIILLFLIILFLLFFILILKKCKKKLYFQKISKEINFI